MGRLKKIPDDVFRNAVKESRCLQEVVEKLGYSKSSGSMGRFVKKRIEEMEIDISHFETTHIRSSHPKYALEDILIENSPYGNINRLKQRILKAGLLKYECHECGNKGEWNGKPLTLQLEHKNGKHNDHRISNLCFLCPNCHSQTDTYSGRNMGRYA